MPHPPQHPSGLTDDEARIYGKLAAIDVENLGSLDDALTDVTPVALMAAYEELGARRIDPLGVRRVVANLSRLRAVSPQPDDDDVEPLTDEQRIDHVLDLLDRELRFSVELDAGTDVDSIGLEALTRTLKVLDDRAANTQANTRVAELEADLAAARASLDELSAHYDARGKALGELRTAARTVFDELKVIPGDYFAGDRLAPVRNALETLAVEAGIA